MSSILDTYLKNKGALKKYLRRYCSSAEEIDDLVQDAFVKAFVAESTQKILFPKAFLFRVAHNLALKVAAKKSYAATERLEDMDDPAVIEDTSQVPADDVMDAGERLHFLAKAIADLPPQCSKVFLLKKIHGLSNKEISERLCISVSTVEKHVALGLVRCGEYFRKHGYEVKSSLGLKSKGIGVPAASSGRVVRIDVRRQDRARDGR